jgi:tripartite-type tricarboxylate transporter receptor subunit TctC
MPRVVLLLLALLLSASAGRAEEPLSFKGKQITVIIASAPGGGTDVSGRLIANFLASHLSGKPTIIVRNLPGAQGVTAMNYFVKQVAADGLTLTMGSTSQADPLLYRKPNSQYDPTVFEMIGGVGRGGTVLLIRKDAEARLFDKNAAPVVMGSLGGIPRSGMQSTAWGVGFLGWNAKWVVGYPGTSELMIALERGEIDMTTTANLFQVKKLVDSGQFTILTQSGSLKNGKLIPRADFGNAPIVSDVIEGKLKNPLDAKAYDYTVSLTSLDKWIALPPNSPKEYVNAYRQAFNAAFTDPEFAELGRKVSEEFVPMSHEDVELLVGKLASTPPEAIAHLLSMLRQQGLQTE